MKKMIKPHKYLDLDNCIISISCSMIKELKSKRIMTYSELYSSIYKKHGENMKYFFVPSINFLFLLGKILYHKEIDSLELIK